MEPDVCIKTHLQLTGHILKVGERVYNLDGYKNIYAIGFGKAGGYMAVALEGVIRERLTSGVVNVRYGYSAQCRIIKVNQAGQRRRQRRPTRHFIRKNHNVNRRRLAY